MPIHSLRARVGKLFCVLLLGQLPALSCAHRDPSQAEAATRRDAHPFLLRAERPEGGALYLLGSIHVGPPAGWRYGADVERAFEASDVLVLEVDMQALAPEAQQALVRRHGLLPEGQSLRDQLRPRTWRLLERAIANSSLEIETLSQMRPWLVLNLLAIDAARRRGYTPESGVDRHFHARAEGRTIVALETPESQLRLLASLAPEFQEIELLDTLDDPRELDETLQLMLESWRSGDAGRLCSILFEGLREHREYAPYYDALIFERNRRWLRQLLELMAKPEHAAQTLFVVVGAAHVLGERGLAALLRARGFRLEEIGPHRGPDESLDCSRSTPRGDTECRESTIACGSLRAFNSMAASKSAPTAHSGLRP